MKSFICSSCHNVYSFEALHTIPIYIKDFQIVSLANRCDECWQMTYRDTLNEIDNWSEDLHENFIFFFQNWDLTIIFEDLINLSLDESKKKILNFMHNLYSSNCTLLNVLIGGEVRE